jgi:adenylate cyclase
MERKPAAILAADVAGYSQLMGVDEEGTLNALRFHREVVDELIATHRGRVFNSAGDSIVAEFPSAVEALNCAVEIQQEMDERNEGVPKNKRLEFRVGLNIGDVMAEGGDLSGNGVNVAARVRELAESGGVCVARNVYNQVKHKVGVAFEPLGAHRVKNVAEPVVVYRVLIGGAASTRRLIRWFRAIWRRKSSVTALVAGLIIGAGCVAAWWIIELPPTRDLGAAGLPKQ